MRRREFIGLVAGIAACPPSAPAQSAKAPRVAFVGAVPPVSKLMVGPLPSAFVGGLRALGYIPGRNFVFKVALC